MREIALRGATLEDEALTYEITKEAMCPYVEQTWGKWDDREQLERHRANFTPATHRIVLVGGVAAGLLAVEHEPSHLWLVKLYLRPEFRSHGVGTRLLHEVLHEAATLGKRVRLRVLRVNARAHAFYLRNGFRVVEETPERLFMEASNGVA